VVPAENRGSEEGLSGKQRNAESSDVFGSRKTVQNSAREIGSKAAPPRGEGMLKNKWREREGKVKRTQRPKIQKGDGIWEGCGVPMDCATFSCKPEHERKGTPKRDKWKKEKEGRFYGAF